MAKNRKDIFAPPTEEELGLFAPPTEDELSSVSSPSEKRASKAKSASAGIAQGLTAGYVPQIVGKLTEFFRPNVISPITGKPITEPYSYLTARDATVRDIKEAEEANPILFGGANLAAGFALPAASGAGALKSMAVPLASGLAYNPGDVEGVVDPLQLEQRTIQGVAAAGLGGAGHLAGKIIGAGGRAARLASEMDKPRFERKMRHTIGRASSDLQKKYIYPRTKASREILKTKEILVDPRFLDDAEMPGLQAALKKRTQGAQRAREAGGFSAPSGFYQKSGVPIEPKPGDQLVRLRADVADRIRRRIEHENDIYKKQKAMGVPEAKKSEKGTSYAANYLRGKRRDVAPEIEEMMGQQAYAIGLRKDLMGQAHSPQAALTSGFWSDQGGKLTDIDAFSGSNLRQLGADLLRARYLRGQPQQDIPQIMQNPVARYGLLGIYNSMRPLNRAGEVAQSVAEQAGIGNLSKGAVDAIIRSLLEQQRLSQSGEE